MSASKLEEALLAQIAEAGLPAPKTEFRFCDRLWRFDLCWDRYKLAVEIEGGTTTRPVQMKGGWWQRVSGHTSMAGYQANCDKYNRAVLEGFRVLRVTRAMIEGKDRAALELIALAVGRAKVEDDFAQVGIRVGFFGNRLPPSLPKSAGGPEVAPFRVGDVVVCSEADRAEAPLLPMTVTEVDPLIGVKCSWFEGTALCWRIYAPCQLRRAAGHGLP